MLYLIISAKSLTNEITYWLIHLKLLSEKQIKVKTYHEVIEINDDKQTVTVCNRQSGETFEESYDTLILSPGADANSLGFESDIAFTLRNFEDTEAIDQFISETDAKHALVVGAGYISLEVLENLHERGLNVTLIHRSNHINKLMDQDMNQPIIDELEKEISLIDSMKKLVKLINIKSLSPLVKLKITTSLLKVLEHIKL